MPPVNFTFLNFFIFVFKYLVPCTDGKISVRIKIAITFIFRFHRRPIQLVVLVPVGPFSNLLTYSAGQNSTRLAEDVNKLTKGLQERTQLIEWDDGET